MKCETLTAESALDSEKFPIVVVHSVRIDASTKDVFDVFKSDDWSWYPGMTSVKWDAPLNERGVGTTRTVTLSPTTKVDEEFVVWNEPETGRDEGLFVFFATNFSPPLLSNLSEEYRLTPVEGEEAACDFAYVVRATHKWYVGPLRCVLHHQMSSAFNAASKSLQNHFKTKTISK